MLEEGGGRAINEIKWIISCGRFVTAHQHDEHQVAFLPLKGELAELEPMS